MVVCCTLVNSTFSSLQLQRQRHQHSHSEEDAEDSSPNSEVIVPDYTVDSATGATNPVGYGSTVVVDLLRRFPSDLIETSVDPEPQLSAAAARVNNTFSPHDAFISIYWRTPLFLCT